LNVAYERTSFAKREEGKKIVGTAAAFKCIAAGVYNKRNKAPLLYALCFKEFSVSSSWKDVFYTFSCSLGPYKVLCPACPLLYMFFLFRFLSRIF
jgi:hypothetical protein